jgi:DNA-binding GntR family transcriptional regulator
MTLAEYIKTDIQRRIDAGQPPPCKLTIAAMAAHYKVSLTPVRTAISQLLDEHYLMKLGNGRLEVRVGPRRPSPASANGPAPKRLEELEEVIRRDVIRASLSGSSDFLREEGTAKKYSVGRTALRPILNRLSGQGFLKYVPRCGWQIRKLDEGDLKSYLDCREALELKALELARPRLVREDLERLLSGNRGDGASPSTVFDNSLHAYWINRSENSYIISFFTTSGRYFMTLLEQLAPEAEVVSQVAGQHCEILQAILEERWADAQKALKRHIRDQLPIAHKAMQHLNAQKAKSAAE